MCAIVLLCQGYCWIGKNTNKEFNRDAYNQTKEHFAIPILFGFNVCPWAIIFLVKFSKIYYLGVAPNVVLSHPLTHAREKKKLSAKAIKNISKCWERYVKRTFQFQFHQTHQKFNFWSTFYIYMVQTSAKILCWRFFCSQLVSFILVSSATLSRKTWNISTLSMLVCYNTNRFFMVLKVSHWCPRLFSSLSRF